MMSEKLPEEREETPDPSDVENNIDLAYWADNAKEAAFLQRRYDLSQQTAWLCAMLHDVLYELRDINLGPIEVDIDDNEIP